jgi:hypothetical protein
MTTVFTEGFVEAYAKSTGEKQVIPEHWLGDPVLGKNFELTPSAKARAAAEAGTLTRVEVPEGDPTDSWTHAQLDQYALDRSIDLLGTKTVKDKVAAIALAAEAQGAGGPGDDPTGGGQLGQAASNPSSSTDQA